MNKSFALLVFVSAALFFGFGQVAPAAAQSYPASQCTSIGGSYASDASSCASGDVSIGSYLNSSCTATGVCCVPSGTAAPTPQTCGAQPCSATPGGICGSFIPSGYTPGGGTCPSGQQCFIPGAGGTCATQGGICIDGACAQQNRRSATGSCVGPDATRTCCTAQTFPSCAGTCRTGGCGSDERVDGNVVCTNTYATCCVVNSVGAPTSVSGSNLGQYTLLEQLPGSSNTVGRLNTYLEDIYRFAFWTVGIAVVFMLTIGGFMYLTSAGNTSRMESAKTVIFDAILGLVLALVAWLFLYVINPDLVNVTLPSATITPVTPATTTTGGGATNQNLAGQIQSGVSGLSLSSGGDCSSASGVVSPASSIAQSAASTPVIACQSGCPGSGQCSRTTTLSETMLRALINVASQYPFTVSSLTGGSHGSTSAHYQGRAVDVVPSSPRAQWPQIAAAFRSQGATLVICDIPNPAGGSMNVSCDDARADHIHAQW